MALSWHKIASFFVEIEERLISSLKRNLTAHRDWEKEEGIQWPAWQAEKLKNLSRYRQQNQEIMDEYTSIIDEETQVMLQEQYKEGYHSQDDVILSDEKVKGTKNEKSSQLPDESFFGINTPRLDSLIEDMQNREERAESSALRMMDDIYRRTVMKAQMAMASGAVTLPQAIDIAVKDFLEKGITCIEYKDGSRHNIADYIQMALRTAATRSYLQGEARRRAELGIDTVLVSQYGQCSETCLPWQGRVYIDDVWGDWDGERSGDRGKSRNGKWYPLLSVAVENGLFHPNCRHTITTWYEGISKRPKSMDSATVNENSALEQMQRKLENKVKKYKRLAEGSSDPQNIKEYKKKVRQAQKELRGFIGKHSDILRRDYWREKTYGVPAVEKSVKHGMLTGINTKYLPITNVGIQNVSMVNSSRLDKVKRKSLQRAHRNLLRSIQSDPVGTEAAAAYDMNMNFISQIKGSTGRVKAPTSDREYIAIHNHPSGNTISDEDIILFVGNSNMQILTVVGNDGSTFLVEKTLEYDGMEFLRYMQNEISRNPDYKKSPENFVDFMERLLRGGRSYGVRYFKGK